MTEGLDGLRERLTEYHELGARFAKWRAVIDIGRGHARYACITPTPTRSRATPRSARKSDIVPIVEPEVLMDGDHDIDACYAVTEWVLKDTLRASSTTRTLRSKASC